MNRDLDQWITKGNIIKFYLPKEEYHKNNKLRKRIFKMGCPLRIVLGDFGNKLRYDFILVLYKEAINLPLVVKNAFDFPEVNPYEYFKVDPL